MAPHSMETILRPPQWPVALSNFVTWCLMWDPRNRPTSSQAMNHEFFSDAVDPLRPKPSTTRLLGRKQSNLESKPVKDPNDGPTLSSKPSWFRKSLVARESAPAVPQQSTKAQLESPRPSPNYASIVHANTISQTTITAKVRPSANKRATWTTGVTPSSGAPMPILPSIRAISPFSDAVTAQAHRRLASKDASKNFDSASTVDTKSSKKIGRQLSVASNGNHYADVHRQEAERALNGNRDSMSPNSNQKEGFMSHLRKRVRRLSGRPQAPLSPNSDDLEANAGCGPWQSNRSSMVIDSSMMDTVMKKNMSELDRSHHGGRHGVEASPSPSGQQFQKGTYAHAIGGTNSSSDRHHSLPQGQVSRSMENAMVAGASAGPVSSRTRRALHLSTQPSHMYETPDEEDELLHEALNSAQKSVKDIDHRKRADDSRYHNSQSGKEKTRQVLQHTANNEVTLNPYPTPSPSAKRNGILFSQNLMSEPTTPLNITKARPKEEVNPTWPTPPYEENEWAASAAASIFAAGSIYQ